MLKHLPEDPEFLEIIGLLFLVVAGLCLVRFLILLAIT